MPLPAPPDVLEVFLAPGEFYFGDARTRIRTILGSCVALALWHPRRHIGGLCHYMLPHRPRGGAGEPLDGRYGDEAIALFMRELQRSDTVPADYQAKLFGGGKMFAHQHAGGRHVDISERNMQAGRALVERHGFRLHAHDMGGEGHRNLILDLWTGDVWLKRVPLGPRGAG